MKRPRRRSARPVNIRAISTPTRAFTCTHNHTVIIDSLPLVCFGAKHELIRMRAPTENQQARAQQHAQARNIQFVFLIHDQCPI